METNASFAKAAGDQPAHRLKLRLSTYEDGPRLVKFYRANQHPEVALRKEAVIRERAINGRSFIYEDEAGEIIASSITYEYCKDGCARPVWGECGSTQVLPQGLGLYLFTIGGQVIHSFLNATPRDHFIASFSKESLNVEKMLIGRLGWKHASGKTEEYLAATGLTKDRGISNALRVWAEATSSTLPRQARIVLDFLRKNAQGELRNRETGHEITIDITGFPFQDDPRLAIMAYGEFARWLETSPDMSFNEAKEKLEMYLDGAFKPPRNIAGPEATP